MGGCFVKSGPFLNAGCIMYSTSIFILHFRPTYLGEGAYAPNAPPAYGPEPSDIVCGGVARSLCACLRLRRSLLAFMAVVHHVVLLKGIDL